ncbi:MAG: hypothetical protein WCA89_14570 [Terracidiphilus sp.]|jgi:hypothetical protein
MKRYWILPIVFVALAIPVVVLAGGSGGFEGVVSSIESRYHVHATRIPFMGVVSAIARTATHEGVANMHVAEIDNFTAEVDGDELNRIVEEKLGAGWERMVRETSRKGHEQTLIFVHPEGERMGMFVVDLDGREMDVVQVSIDPRHLNDSIVKYEHHNPHDDSDDSN